VLTTDTRIAMLADLLGVSCWEQADADAVGLAGSARAGAKVPS
jgi:hypothetical protein